MAKIIRRVAVPNPEWEEFQRYYKQIKRLNYQISQYNVTADVPKSFSKITSKTVTKKQVNQAKGVLSRLKIVQRAVEQEHAEIPQHLSENYDYLGDVQTYINERIYYWSKARSRNKSSFVQGYIKAFNEAKDILEDAIKQFGRVKVNSNIAKYYDSVYIALSEEDYQDTDGTYQSLDIGYFKSVLFK